MGLLPVGVSTSTPTLVAAAPALPLWPSPPPRPLRRPVPPPQAEALTRQARSKNRHLSPQIDLSRVVPGELREIGRRHWLCPRRRRESDVNCGRTDILRRVGPEHARFVGRALTSQRYFDGSDADAPWSGSRNIGEGECPISCLFIFDGPTSHATFVPLLSLFRYDRIAPRNGGMQGYVNPRASAATIEGEGTEMGMGNDIRSHYGD